MIHFSKNIKRCFHLQENEISSIPKAIVPFLVPLGSSGGDDKVPHFVYFVVTNSLRLRAKSIDHKAATPVRDLTPATAAGD